MSKDDIRYAAIAEIRYLTYEDNDYDQVKRRIRTESRSCMDYEPDKAMGRLYDMVETFMKGDIFLIDPEDRRAEVSVYVPVGRVIDITYSLMSEDAWHDVLRSKKPHPDPSWPDNGLDA